MRFQDLLQVVAEEPVFETGLLLAGDHRPDDVRRQLSRWRRAGRLHQLRRGLYTLSPPWQRIKPHPFLVANRLQLGSYVSLLSALAYHGCIPEYVALVTSVGSGRPRRWETPLGRFEHRHVRPELVRDFRWVEVASGQWAFVASPEKALLDLVYLEPGADDPDYLRELRLQNLEPLDRAELERLAGIYDQPKLRRAVALLADLAEQERAEYEPL